MQSEQNPMSFHHATHWSARADASPGHRGNTASCRLRKLDTRDVDLRNDAAKLRHSVEPTRAITSISCGRGIAEQDVVGLTGFQIDEIVPRVESRYTRFADRYRYGNR